MGAYTPDNDSFSIFGHLCFRLACIQCASRVSKISYIASDILEAHYLTSISLLDGTLEGRLKTGDAQQFVRRFGLLTFLQVSQEIVHFHMVAALEDKVALFTLSAPQATSLNLILEADALEWNCLL